ncbi:MAG: esterase/lipase-like protein [Bacilli bacterium]|nr:esterase/lipase-like protein [Bacilli bacterium]
MLLWPEGAPHALGNDTEDCPSITPYILETAEPTACVIVCPGGGYTHRAAHEGEPIARWLNRNGMSAVVLNYRVAPYKHPSPLLDAQRAIRFVRAHADEWRIDLHRVGILGFSAGGHLAATVGTHYDSGREQAADPIERHSCRPDLLVLCYAVISLLDSPHTGSRKNLTGDEAEDQLLHLLSNERHVTDDTPPTFLWHTADDASVPVENCFLFARALNTHKVPFELHVFESGRHGLGLALDNPNVKPWTDLCALWLKKQGF